MWRGHGVTNREQPDSAIDAHLVDEDPSESFRRRYGLYISAIVVALFFVRVLGEPWDTRFPPQFPDALNPGRTDTYYAVAGLTPFRPSFYWAPRPFLYPPSCGCWAETRISSCWRRRAPTARRSACCA